MRALHQDYRENPAPIMEAARKIKRKNFAADLQIPWSLTAVSNQEAKKKIIAYVGHWAPAWFKS